MMTLQPSVNQNFSDALEAIRSEIDAEDSLAKWRISAWERFQELKLPAGREEVFQYVTLRKLYARPFQKAQLSSLDWNAIAPYVIPECKQSLIVFVNGYYVPELSRTGNLPKNVLIQQLDTAFQGFSALLSNQWQRYLKEGGDPFAMLNAALHPAGAFIYVPPKTNVDVPLQVLSVIDAQDQQILIMPRLQGFVGMHSSLTMVTRNAVLSGQGYANVGAVDIAIEENAHVHLNQLSTSNLTDTWHFEAFRAMLKRNSTLDHVAIVSGGEGMRHDYRVALTGEDATANLSGIAFLAEKNEAHVHVLMDHQAPNCRSMQFFKNVLRDSAKSSFEGKIYVHPIAQKTDAFQLNKNLILSDSAQAFCKPNLEIFADDVKASHGATVGQLDDESMFYLLARGLDRSTAHSILIQGFCSEILEKLTVSSLSKEVGMAALRYIAEGEKKER